MRMRFGGAMVLALSLGVACSNRDDTAATPAAGGAAAGGAAPAGAAAPAPAPAGQPAGARGAGAGAQAAARMTPEQLEAAMKSIAQSNGALQKNLKSNMLMEAAKDAQQLATLFGDVERFWTQYDKPDAVKVAQTARASASDAAGAAAAGDQMKAMAAATAVLGTCKQCHSLYREGDAATGYRIKEGTITQ
jgi:cytochrome c556